MKKRPSITLLTVLLTMVFAAGIGVYSSYIGMKIYQESSDHLLESFSQISETFTLFVQRNWTVLRQWDGLLKNADIDHAGSIGADMQANKESWHYSDFYLFNESTQYLTADGRRGSADSISGVFQEMYSEGGPIVSTYTASYGVPKIVFAMPLSRNMTLDGVTYTGLAVSYDTDVVDDLVDGSMYGGQSDCYIVRANGDIVLALEPQTELCEGLTNLYDLDAHADWIYGTMDDIKDCVQLGRSGSAQFTCQGGRNYLVAIPTAFPDWTLTTLSTGWYQLTDGVRREVTLPAKLPAEPGQTITLYNDTLTDSDGGKVLSARGVEYGIEIRAGETLLYRYEDNAFPKNAQMRGRLWADAELPDNIGGQTFSLTLTPLSGRAVALDAPVLGTAPAVTGRHIQSSLFSIGMMLAMLVLAVLALLIFFYMSFFGIRERRFLDVAVFLLLCSLWCLTDSGLYQIYGRDTAAGSVISFYAFMTMPVPMVHFVRNTVSGRLRLVPDVCIALFCANALAQGAAYRLLGVPFIAMLPLTHLLLTAGVAAMLTVLFRSYREQPAPQLRLRIEAFAALGAFGVAALVLYWLLHIYWYDAVYQFGVLLFIILLLYGLISQAVEDMRFHMEHRISHEMQREDRMTGLPNRRAFEEYMERIRTGKAGCRDAVLTYIRLEGLNERNDRFGLQAGDESVIAAAQCVADFCRACEEAGESVLCFRTGGNEFALIRPEPHTDSGQLHRQFRAVVARYNRTCAPRARIIMTFGFSRLCDEDGKSRSISAWKAEADAHLKRNEAGLGGDAE